MIKSRLRFIPWKERIQLFFTVLFVTTLPFSRELNQVFYVLFLLGCLPLLSHGLWKERNKFLLAFITVYLMALVSAVAAPDSAEAFSKLEIQFALLLTPMIFGCSYRPEKAKDQVISFAFVAGVTGALVFLLTCFLADIRNGACFDTLLRPDKLNHAYAAPLGIHASFFSVYVAVSAWFVLDQMEKASSWFYRLLLFSIFLLCLVSIFLLLSRVVLVVFLVCLLGRMTFHGIRNQKYFSTITAFFLTAFMVLLFTKQSSYFNERFEGELYKDLKFHEWVRILEGEQPMVLADDGSRIERWYAAGELISGKPFLGYGTGQEKPMLFEKYRELSLNTSLEQEYDAHNQFLSSMIQSGIFGLISLLILFLTAFNIAISKRQGTYLVFLILVFSICMVDNYLSVNKGIFFFSFFNVFFFLRALAGARSPVIHEPGPVVRSQDSLKEWLHTGQ